MLVKLRGKVTNGMIYAMLPFLKQNSLSLTSTWSLKGFSKLGAFSTGVDNNKDLMFLKVFWHSLVDTNFLCFWIGLRLMCRHNQKNNRSPIL